MKIDKKQLKEKWDRLKDFIAPQMRRMNVGNGVVGRLWAPVNYTLILLTFLKVYTVSLSMEQMVGIGFVIVSGVFLLGLFWDKSGLYQRELTFDGKRNKMFQMLNDTLERKLEELKEK